MNRQAGNKNGREKKLNGLLAVALYSHRATFPCILTHLRKKEVFRSIGTLPVSFHSPSSSSSSMAEDHCMVSGDHLISSGLNGLGFEGKCISDYLGN